MLRLGLEAHALGIAHEFDPYFGLSISRVIKGLAAATGTILLSPNEHRVAEDRPDCFWLYIVTDCASDPTLREPIPNPARFPWHEVTKVEHYWMQVDAMAKPAAPDPQPPPSEGAAP